jgi:hypothetical protein
MKTKPFSQEVHDACDPPARDAVIEWIFHEWGWKACPNEDIYGVDLLAYKNKKLMAYVEIETRDWLGKDVACPYDTIHIPKRKNKFFNKRLPTFYFVVTRDFKNAYWAYDEEIVQSSVKEIRNKAVKEGEYFYDVPIGLFQYVNLEVPF